MSWFLLKNQPSRRKRKGICLRLRFCPDVQEAIRKSKLMRKGESPWQVVILELRPKGKVLLQVWCHALRDMVRSRHRSNVFCVLVDENPEWTCEGDLGRGLS